MQILDEINAGIKTLLSKKTAAPKPAATEPPTTPEDEPTHAPENCASCNGTGSCGDCSGTGDCPDCKGEGKHVAKAGSRANLEADLKAAQAAIAAKDLEITKLKADHEKELVSIKGQVAAAIAAQGLAPALVPTASTEIQPGTKVQSAFVKWSEMTAKDPIGAAAFYGSHADEIWKSMPR